MNPYWVTFGCGGPYAGYYCVIDAPSIEEATTIATDRYWTHWSAIYRSAEEAGVERFKLLKMPIRRRPEREEWPGPPKMKKFWITFGSGQPNANCYLIVEADNAIQAAEVAHERFGREWSCLYHSAATAGVEKFGLREIK